MAKLTLLLLAATLITLKTDAKSIPHLHLGLSSIYPLRFVLKSLSIGVEKEPHLFQDFAPYGIEGDQKKPTIPPVMVPMEDHTSDNQGEALLDQPKHRATIPPVMVPMEDYTSDNQGEALLDQLNHRATLPPVMIPMGGLTSDDQGETLVDQLAAEQNAFIPSMSEPEEPVISSVSEPEEPVIPSMSESEEPPMSEPVVNHDSDNQAEELLRQLATELQGFL